MNQKMGQDLTGRADEASGCKKLYTVVSFCLQISYN